MSSSYKVGETVLYGKEGVCLIDGTEVKKFGPDAREYYILKPLFHKNSTVYVPMDNEKLMSSMRRVLAVDEIHSLIFEVNEGEPIWVEDDNERREIYHSSIADADCKTMAAMLRGLYYKREELKISGKKMRRFDEDYFMQAQNLLFDEFAVVLEIPKDKVLPLLVKEKPAETKGE